MSADDLLFSIPADLAREEAERARDAGVAARVAHLEDHPTVRAIRAADQARVAAEAADAARAAAAPALPPPLEHCEKHQQVQHRVRGWVGEVLSVMPDGSSAYVRIVTSQYRCTAWFRVADLCEPQQS